MTTEPSFGKEVKRIQDEVLVERDSRSKIDDISKTYEKLFGEGTSTRQPRRFSKRVLIAAAAALACTALVFTMYPFDETRIVEPKQESKDFRGGDWIAAPHDSKRPVDFLDGSKMILMANSNIRVVDSNMNGAKVLIEKGRAEVAVKHTEKTDWRVQAGPYSINVTGTVFELFWDPSDKYFELFLKEGSVEVKGPMITGGTVLTENESIKAWVLEKQLEIGSLDNALALNSHREHKREDLETQGDAGAYSKKRPSKKTEESGKGLKWVELNRLGLFGDVVEDAKKRGISSVLKKAPSTDLLELADASRLIGQMDLAKSAYGTVRKRFGGTKSASTAAFALGKMAFDKNREYGEAAKWFTIYLREQDHGPLAKSALGLSIEARKKSGDEQGAKEAAIKYVERYPAGPHVGLARQIAAED